MQLIRRTMPVNFNAFLFGDQHLGSILSYREGWEKLVDMMNSPYDGLKANANFGIDHGDVIEAIMIDDPRFDGVTTEANILQQMDQAIEDRKPIRDKLICILEGNHPLKLWKFGRITERICNELGVVYGTWSSRITYVDRKGKLLFKHFATHGHRTINSTADDPKRRKTNMELSLKRLLKYKAGDVLLASTGKRYKNNILVLEKYLAISILIIVIL